MSLTSLLNSLPSWTRAHRPIASKLVEHDPSVVVVYVSYQNRTVIKKPVTVTSTTARDDVKRAITLVFRMVKSHVSGSLRSYPSDHGHLRKAHLVLVLNWIGITRFTRLPRQTNKQVSEHPQAKKTKGVNHLRRYHAHTLSRSLSSLYFPISPSIRRNPNSIRRKLEDSSKYTDFGDLGLNFC